MPANTNMAMLLTVVRQKCTYGNMAESKLLDLCKISYFTYIKKKKHNERFHKESDVTRNDVIRGVMS